METEKKTVSAMDENNESAEPIVNEANEREEAASNETDKKEETTTDKPKETKEEVLKRMRENAESVIEEMNKHFEKCRGVTRESGPFTVRVLKDMRISVRTVSGFQIIYPAYTGEWAIMMAWIDRWNEDDIRTFDGFIKCVVFPSATRIVDIDAEYVQTIVKAHTDLTERNEKKGLYKRLSHGKK